METTHSLDHASGALLKTGEDIRVIHQIRHPHTLHHLERTRGRYSSVALRQ